MEAGSKNRPSFYLSKWYMDGVDDAGHVLVGYAARLNWHNVHINYSGLLTFEDSGISKLNSFRHNGTPVFRDNATIWKSNRLRLKGVWRSLDAPIESKLIESKCGDLLWRCYQPRAHVDVTVEGKQLLQSAMGYVEKLDMTIKPWELPFNEIRWGRYLSDTDAVVWICWDGESQRNLCFYNGKMLENVRIGGREIVLSEDLGVIVLNEQITLRKGHSLSAIIAGLPRLREHLTARITNLYESKWRSRGSRILNGKIISTGWTIHEVVRW